jgi:hypothetical protein
MGTNSFVAASSGYFSGEYYGGCGRRRQGKKSKVTSRKAVVGNQSSVVSQQPGIVARLRKPLSDKGLSESVGRPGTKSLDSCLRRNDRVRVHVARHSSAVSSPLRPLHCKGATSCSSDKKSLKKDRRTEPQKTKKDAEKTRKRVLSAPPFLRFLAFLSAMVFLVAAGGRAGISAVRTFFSWCSFSLCGTRTYDRPPGQFLLRLVLT